MQRYNRTLSNIVRLVAMLAVLLAGSITAQSQPKDRVQKSGPGAPAATQQELAATQEQLFKLLRISPTLTEVVERDPSLLADQEYVSRTNPELAQFLESHPEIARNPDFYLFSGLNENGGPSDQALERKVWPELPRQRQEPPMLQYLINDVGPFLIFLCILGAFLWLIQVLLANRRWGRIFKLQMEAHGKLIDRFSTNQELLVYMETEAGRRFLEAAPIPVDFESEHRVPNAVARVLTPLQIGIVLSMLGAGLLFLRNSNAELTTPLLVLGIVVLMPGLGFMISAGITWMLAGRLGLMPERSAHGIAADDAKERR